MATVLPAVTPVTREVTQIEEQIAAARALSDLAHQLLSAAAGQIEGITHQHAHLSLQTVSPAQRAAGSQGRGQDALAGDAGPPGSFLEGMRTSPQACAAGIP